MIARNYLHRKSRRLYTGNITLSHLELLNGRAESLKRQVFYLCFHDHLNLQESLMGVETPIPPKMMNAAAPGGAPPRRIKTLEISIGRFLWFGYEPDRFMLVSPENFF